MLWLRPGTFVRITPNRQQAVDRGLIDDATRDLNEVSPRDEVLHLPHRDAQPLGGRGHAQKIQRSPEPTRSPQAKRIDGRRSCSSADPPDSDFRRSSRRTPPERQGADRARLWRDSSAVGGSRWTADLPRRTDVGGIFRADYPPHVQPAADPSGSWLMCLPGLGDHQVGGSSSHSIRANAGRR